MPAKPLQPIFSVSEFNQMINQHLKLLEEVVVEGEISELNISNNKWLFATIKDDKASLGLFGMVFNISNLSAIEIGMKVKVYGQPGLFQKSGKFNLNVQRIVPSGEGALKLAYEKLKQKLLKDGLFDPEKKRELPSFPQTIGLITAKNSQAYQDFIKIINHRTGGLKIYFYPVNVQGEKAVSSITRAIDYFNTKQKTDVLVLTRGGGSLEDLLAFNDESVTLAVSSSKTPTICAIGHEGDISLVELAADLRASTPSNAAELIVRKQTEVVREIYADIDNFETQILFKINQLEEGVNHQLSLINQHLKQSFNLVDELIAKIYHQFKFFEQNLEHLETNINNLKQNLINLNPKHLLKRGFCIVKDQQGKIILSINQVKKDQKMATILTDGRINSLVLNKQKGAL